MESFRQGDVIVRRVARIPKSAVKQPENSIAIPGETGNLHEMEGVEVYTEGSSVYIQTNDNTMTHSQHNGLFVRAGRYLIDHVRRFVSHSKPIRVRD